MCGVEKDCVAFYPSNYKYQESGERSLRSYCSDCEKAERKRYYAEEGRKRVQERAWAAQGFTFTVEEYDAMLAAQGDGCAICGAATNKSGRRLSVDHCHDTGRVRGILCTNCNVGIGRFRDDPELVSRALEYLERHSMKVVV